MVKIKLKNNKKYFICEECSFAYKEKAIAMECEDWCKKHQSCNTEITKHAVEI